jgi:hypothetical protein
MESFCFSCMAHVLIPRFLSGVDFVSVKSWCREYPTPISQLNTNPNSIAMQKLNTPIYYAQSLINYNSSSHAPDQHPSTPYSPNSPAPMPTSPFALSALQEVVSQSQHSFYPFSFELLLLQREVLAPVMLLVYI